MPFRANYRTHLPFHVNKLLYQIIELLLFPLEKPTTMNDPLIIAFLFLLLLLIGSLLLVLNGRGERGEMTIFVFSLVIGFFLLLQLILLFSCHNLQVQALDLDDTFDIEF